MSNDGEPVLQASGVSRTYHGGGRPFPALRGASLCIGRGEVVAIMGPSGSGKSTLLYILAGLDKPDAGDVRIAGSDWQSVTGEARAQFRRRHCGFITQGMSLLPQATAAENVDVPLVLDGVPLPERNRRVMRALEQVGLARHGAQLTDQLSGGEQQRVAIARALVLDPAVVLADEPTGSLDSVTGQSIASLIVSAARERGAAVVIVTHDPAVSKHAQSVRTMQSGVLQ